jgi:hypothetical protein
VERFELFNLPGAYLWIPGLSFLLLFSAIYWVLRRTELPPAVPSEPERVTISDGTVVLTTAAPLAAKPGENRVSTRRQGNPIELFIADPHHKDDPEHGLLLDRSLGGVRMIVYHDIEVGRVIAIRPTKADEMVPWIDLEVRSCVATPSQLGEFELGCRFVKIPPYSILLHFG